MGRGKLSLKLIPNFKSRSTTFQKRKKSLMKKAYELSTLCDVRTCVLVHGPALTPNDDPSYLQSEEGIHTWPPNRSEVEGMIRAYKNNSFRKQKCFDLYEFFSDRKRKVETEICKLRENPNSDNWLDSSSECELRELMDGLDSKIEAASGMIDFMETDHDHLFGEGALAVFDDHQYDLVETGADLNPPETALVELDFPELAGPNGNQLGFDFEDLQSLFEDNAYANLMNDELEYVGKSEMEENAYANLLNDEFEYGNNLEYLMMTGSF